MPENLILSVLLIIPLISSYKGKVVNTTHDSNKTLLELPQNISTLEIMSEGGSLLPKNVLLPLSLPKENHTNLISLDKEIGRTKEKSIVARKGAVFTPVTENIHKNADSARERIDTTIAKHEPNLVKESKKNSSVVMSVIDATTKMSLNTSKIVSTTSSKPPKPKKPLFVSYEALAETDSKVVPKIEYSSKLMVSDQLPTPNIRTHPVNVNSHPGMVMPLVITILVVPMFVVLGYMALRKGKEAWKNRHYKRMDFLLDGMYND